MNILIINPILFTPPQHGGRVQRLHSIKHTMIYNYALGFLELGHRVTLIASDEYRPDTAETADFPIIYLPNTAKRLCRFFPNGLPLMRGLGRYLRAHAAEYDLVISSELMTFHTITAARICPEKMIVWQETAAHYPALFSKIWYRLVVKRYIGDRIPVAGRSVAAQAFVRRYCGHVAEAIIDHGVNIHNFAFEPLKKPYFIVVARLDADKCIDQIIRVFADFHQRYRSDFQLWLAGNGPEADSLRHLSRACGVEEQVHFLGFLPHDRLAKAVGQATAALIRTCRDLNMVSVPETLACGTPILTNTVPLSATYIATNGLGIVRDQWTADDLQAMVAQCDTFVENCRLHRDEQSSTCRAEKMIAAFHQFHSLDH